MTTEREKRDLLERLAQKQTDVLTRPAPPAGDRADEVIRSDRKRDRVADRLVESVVALSRRGRAACWGTLVEVVAARVIVAKSSEDVDAHLDAQVIDGIDVPRARVAHDLAMRGLTKSERSQKVFGSGSKPSEVKNPGHRTIPRAPVPRAFRIWVGQSGPRPAGRLRDNVVPGLSPHVAEKVRSVPARAPRPRTFTKPPSHV
jgi:hypothetical protein